MIHSRKLMTFLLQSVRYRLRQILSCGGAATCVLCGSWMRMAAGFAVSLFDPETGNPERAQALHLNPLKPFPVGLMP